MRIKEAIKQIVEKNPGLVASEIAAALPNLTDRRAANPSVYLLEMFRAKTLRREKVRLPSGAFSYRYWIADHAIEHKQLQLAPPTNTQISAQSFDVSSDGCVTFKSGDHALFLDNVMSTRLRHMLNAAHAQNASK